MERLTKLTPKFIDRIPVNLEEGILYISEEFQTSSHLCPCGCGKHAVTPFNDWPDSWTLTRSGAEGETVTLSPSILNPNCPNKAHYFIRENRVDWC